VARGTTTAAQDEIVEARGRHHPTEQRKGGQHGQSAARAARDQAAERGLHPQKIRLHVLMALSEDQRAMLQLLLERGQSYEDIGSLLGIEVDEVRTRARAALTEMGGADPDKEVGLTDYLLGQADPIGRADAARHLQSDDDARALAEKLIIQLRLLAPGAELPDPSGGRGRVKPASSGETARPGAREERPGFAASLSQRQRVLLGGLLGGGLLLVLIILLATGTFSGDSGTSSSSSQTSAKSKPSDKQGPPRAVLQPTGSSKGKGVAALGQTKNVPVIQLNAVNLDPAPSGQHYTLWLYRSKRVALRLGATTVSKRGRILAQFPVPAQAIPYIGNGTFEFIDLSLTSDAQYRSEVKTATSSRTLPPYTGSSVLRGRIVGAGVGTTPTPRGTGGASTTPGTGTGSSGSSPGR
jgi:hypothetical protein